MAYKIDKSKCVGCGTCINACPMGAIRVDADGKCIIDPKICVSCGACTQVCPMTAIEPAQ
ncbi:MAG: 4Fe-4S binding protein [Alphaproteobacteria bacterium]|nr:4Fe-4S binding protein [Alphaproteobacteria bacterium]